MSRWVPIVLAFTGACGVGFDGTPASTETSGDGGRGGTATVATTAGVGANATGGGSIASVGGGGGSSSSSAGGSSSPLADEGLLARYWIDESDSGTSPASLDDAASDPVPLSVVFDDGLAFTSDANHRALRYPQPNQGGHAYALVDGTKLATLNGTHAATLEAVVHLKSATDLGARIVHVGASTSFFSLESNGVTHLKLDYNDVDGLGIGTWTVADLDAAGRVVIHGVVDTDEAAPSDRVRLYIDGVLQSGGTLAPPNQGDAIALPPGQSLVLGNRLPAERSMGGNLYYAALYLTALTQSQIDQNVSALLTSDDR